MADLLKKGLLTLMSEQCYDNYFVDFNFVDVPCFVALLSKGLGLGIIAGSMLVKVPQIVKILNAKSVEGISLFSVLLDLFAITCHMSYSFVSGFPFSAWGDSAFVGIQTAIIAVLVLYFARSAALAAVFGVFYCVCCFIGMGGMTTQEVLWTMQGFNIPVLLVGKLSQAVANYKNGSTGQLSAVTAFMLFFGSLARIFTSWIETKDPMMMLTYGSSTFANTVIVLQFLYYWNVDKTKGAAGDEKKQQKAKPKSKKAD